MLSFDENDSGDDYEFDPNFALQNPKRERVAFQQVEWHADSLQRRAKDMLDKVDKSGVWIVSTTGGALLITAFDSLFDTGTVDPVALSKLAPDWITNSFVLDLLAKVCVDPDAVTSAEATLQGIFLFEFCLRAWAERFSVQYLKSPVALVDFASILPSIDTLFGGLGGAAASASLRPLRLFRLLRLLRLLDDGKSGQTADRRMTDKVTSVAIEFLCLFLISGELFYDLEYQYNPNISDIGDALYWSFLTLTGIGQPFEAVTAAGRVATVGSILTALVVVPLQLAKIVGNQAGHGGGGGMSGTMQGGMLGGSTLGGVSLGGGGGGGGVVQKTQSNAFAPRLAEVETSRLSNQPGTSQPKSPPQNLEIYETFDSSIYETFDSVDEAYAAEVFKLAPEERGAAAVNTSAAYESVWTELLETRVRLRKFETEIDALRNENEQLRLVVTRRTIKASAERKA